MRFSFVVASVALVAFPQAVVSQSVSIELHGVAATNRQSGVVLFSEPGRGVGWGSALNLSWGRIHLEGTAILAGMERDRGSTTDSWDLTQLNFRFRFDLFGPFALEGFGVRQFLEPDFNGNELAYVGGGGYGEIAIARDARLWVRLGVVATAAFKGAGLTALTTETQMGFVIDLSRRLALVGSYGFQRVDRKVGGETSELVLDVLRVGVKMGLLGGVDR